MPTQTDFLIKNTPLMMTGRTPNTSQEYMQRILYDMTCKLRDGCPATTRFEDSRKKFIVSPDVMEHIQKAYWRSLYRPNRDRTKTLTIKPQPTFIGIPIEVEPRMKDSCMRLNAVFPGSNLVMGVQQVIPFGLLSSTIFWPRDKLTIIVKSRVNLPCGFLPNELVALGTLREMISESDYRKYVVHGFILVRAESGKTYQIFRDRSHTKVWVNGKVVEEICVRISDRNMPATDNVIALKTILEHSEEEFHKIGNVYRMAA